MTGEDDAVLLGIVEVKGAAWWSMIMTSLSLRYSDIKSVCAVPMSQMMMRSSSKS